MTCMVAIFYHLLSKSQYTGDDYYPCVHLVTKAWLQLFLSFKEITYPEYFGGIMAMTFNAGLFHRNVILWIFTFQNQRVTEYWKKIVQSVKWTSEISLKTANLMILLDCPSSIMHGCQKQHTNSLAEMEDDFDITGFRNGLG